MKHLPLIRDSLLFLVCLALACGAEGIGSLLVH